MWRGNSTNNNTSVRADRRHFRKRVTFSTWSTGMLVTTRGESHTSTLQTYKHLDSDVNTYSLLPLSSPRHCATCCQVWLMLFYFSAGEPGFQLIISPVPGGSRLVCLPAGHLARGLHWQGPPLELSAQGMPGTASLQTHRSGFTAVERVFMVHTHKMTKCS